MAKLLENSITIKLSKLVKDHDTEGTVIVTSDILQALEQVAQELVGQNVIVEIIED